MPRRKSLDTVDSVGVASVLPAREKGGGNKRMSTTVKGSDIGIPSFGESSEEICYRSLELECGTEQRGEVRRAPSRRARIK